ncbi:MAG TPA: ATP-binding protein [Candidatus Eisenbacteria bacterium]|nr:ATP-binding protein [Candidatus Eisenbacteria bacterium]
MKPRTSILIVDDRPDGLLALEAALASPDYEIVKASSGKEAVALLFDRTYAVILLDVQMPGMDGFETARVIKQLNPSRDTPIIFVTAINKEAAHINRGYDAGAVDYIFKPLDPNVVRSKVKIFVELYEKNLKIREQADLLLEYQSQVTKTITDNATVALFMTDREGRVTFSNPAAEALTGYEAHEIHGSRLADILREEPQDGPPVCTSERLSEPIRECESVFTRKDHSRFCGSVSTSPLVQNGERAGAVVEIRDITEAKRAEESLREAANQLARSNRDLEQFAYVASHDLQEPLRKILSFSDRLKDPGLKEIGDRERDYFERMQGAAMRMRTLIDDLLNFSRVTVRESHFEEVDLGQVISEVLYDLEVRIKQTGAVVEVDPLPPIVANPSQMRQLFQNLISNAVKFAKKDEAPRIRVSWRRAVEGGFFEIVVEDNGIGFEEKYLDRIFKPFQRLHARTEFEGTGIGLAICQKILQRHGGHITARSAPGRGSSFVIGLPLLRIIDASTETPNKHASVSAD